MALHRLRWRRQSEGALQFEEAAMSSIGWFTWSIDSISLPADAPVETMHKIVDIEETKSVAFA